MLPGAARPALDPAPAPAAAAAPRPPSGSTAMPTIPFAALQATGPASEGLTATSTSAIAVLPEVADGVPMARTTASAASVPPEPPGLIEFRIA